MNRSIKILAFAIVVLVVVAAIYSVVNAPPPTTITMNQNRYALPQKYLPNNGYDYVSNYTFVTGLSSLPPAGPGVLYTAVKTYANTTVVSSPDTPLQAYSVVKVCNSATNATQLFNTFKNTRVFQNGSLPSNTTILQLPQIGDQTLGFLVVWKVVNMNLFVVQYTTANIYVRIGIWESLNSTSTTPLLNISRGMLATLQGG